jgi:hypothetical protein
MITALMVMYQLYYYFYYFSELKAYRLISFFITIRWHSNINEVQSEFKVIIIITMIKFLSVIIILTPSALIV